MTEAAKINIFPILTHFNGPQAKVAFPFTSLTYDFFAKIETDSPLSSGNYLRGISTDGIIPARDCLIPDPSIMASHAMTGLNNIPLEYLREHKINALVSGTEFGCGSSRVHAPQALAAAGIEYIFVVGEAPDTIGQAERIFRDNAVAIGGPYIIGLRGDSQAISEAMKRLGEGDLEELIWANYTPLERSIMAAGGLTAFNMKRKNGEIKPEEIEIKNTTSRTQTAVEKIISTKAKNFAQNSIRVVKPGDITIIPVDLTFAYELQTEIMIAELERHFSEEEIRKQLGSGHLVLFQDHTVSSTQPKYRRLRAIQQAIAKKYNIPIQGAGQGVDRTDTICHTHFRDTNPQLPGIIIKGSDSHTPTSGVTGALAIGDGAITIANDAFFGETMLKVPESIQVVLRGELPQNCTMKDVMLRILVNPRIQKGDGIDRVLEYSGDGIASTPVDDLSVLTNMAVEAGATSGIVVEPNTNVVKHLSEKHNLSEEQVRSMFEAIKPDANAEYAMKIELDITQMTPMIAIDDNPRNAVAIAALSEPIPITKAYIGSCTGGNFTDIENAAKMITELPSGSKSSVPLVVQPSSIEILEKAQELGYIDILTGFGAQVLLPGCGACLGMGPGGVDGPNQTVFSTTNRNFQGRMGKGENSHVILGSVKSVIKACASGLIN